MHKRKPSDYEFYTQAVKDKQITNRQKKQLLNWLKQFYKETKSGEVYMQPNGFTAVGRLKKKTRHHPKQPPINNILIADTESTSHFRSISCRFEYMTEEEAITLASCILKTLQKK